MNDSKYTKCAKTVLKINVSVNQFIKCNLIVFLFKFASIFIYITVMRPNSIFPLNFPFINFIPRILSSQLRST